MTTEVVGSAPLIQFPRAQLRDMIQSICGQKTVWDNEPLPFVAQRSGKPGVYVELMVTHTETKGVDETRLTYDPVNQVNGVTLCTVRIYTVKIRVVSFNKDIPAFDVMDQIRRGLRSDSAHNEYTNINIAIVDWGKTIDVPVEKDNREASQSVLEVRFSWSSSADPGDNSGGVILTAPVTGTLTP